MRCRLSEVYSQRMYWMELQKSVSWGEIKLKETTNRSWEAVCMNLMRSKENQIIELGNKFTLSWKRSSRMLMFCSGLEWLFSYLCWLHSGELYSKRLSGLPENNTKSAVQLFFKSTDLLRIVGKIVLGTKTFFSLGRFSGTVVIEPGAILATRRSSWFFGKEGCSCKLAMISTSTAGWKV